MSYSRQRLDINYRCVQARFLLILVFMGFFFTRTGKIMAYYGAPRMSGVQYLTPIKMSVMCLFLPDLFEHGMQLTTFLQVL